MRFTATENAFIGLLCNWLRISVCKNNFFLVNDIVKNICYSIAEKSENCQITKSAISARKLAKTPAIIGFQSAKTAENGR